MVARAGKLVAGWRCEPDDTATVDPRRPAHRRPVHRDQGGRSPACPCIEARDLDHALALAKLIPIVDGGVEVRPLIGFQVLD